MIIIAVQGEGDERPELMFEECENPMASQTPANDPDSSILQLYAFFLRFQEKQ